MNKCYRGGGPTDLTVYALWVNFIRLVDVSVREYELARRRIDGKSPNLPRINVATGHFESLLSTLKRAIAHLKALRSHRDAPTSLKRLLPGRSKVLSGSVEKRVTGMRDAIQHLDEKVIKGAIHKGEPVCLVPEIQGVRLGNFNISYQELASWIQELHHLAGEVTHYKEPPKV